MSGLVVFAHETWFTDGAFPLDWGFAAHGLGRRLERVLVSRSNVHPAALRGERLRAGKADAFGAARDQNRLAFQTEIHASPRVVGMRPL